MGQLAKKEMTNVQKIAYAIEGLTNGVSRENLAEDLGYRNYKCMDIFLNRNGYKWDKQKQNYEAQQVAENTKTALLPQGKAEQVVRLIANGKDIKETAVLIGLGDAKSLAIFMRAKDYMWDDGTRNYVKVTIVEDISSTDVTTEGKAIEITAPVSTAIGITLSFDEQFLLKQALPLLQQLLENKETLEKLMCCSEADDESTLIRLKIPGRYMTKSVHMSDQMDLMVRDYSVQKNVKQKEVFEIALVEFFRKHGFDREINTLLGA